VEQLRIPHGIPVITKADLADPDWIELITEELGSRLAVSPVSFEPPLVVSAVSGQGIEALRERLRARLEGPAAAPVEDGFRMPIDRAFSLAGVGTVVTGTPWSGRLRIGDTVTILPGAGREGRVRSLEAYGRPRSEAGPGARTAVGLAGVERADIARGDVLVAGDLPWRATTALDVALELLPGAPPLKRRLRVRLHLGTAEVQGRLYPRGEPSAAGAGHARIALEAEIVARGGDRFVLRSYSPVATIGGGVVLDPMPPRRAPWPEGLADPDPARRATALITRRSRGVATNELPVLLGLPDRECRVIAAGLREVTAVGTRLVGKRLTAAMRDEAIRRVAEFHREQPSEKGMSLETLRKGLRGPLEVAEAVLSGMTRRGELVAADGLVSTPGFVPRLADGDAVLDRVVNLLEQAGLEPPTVEELERQTGIPGLLTVLRFGARSGRVVGVESNRFFSSQILTNFLTLVRELASQGPLTPPMVRERTGLSRKYLIPLLEYADRAGVTRRVGEARVLNR
ncbi:MAG TPA: SelB C-terminal domain-containing protein, partial [Gemmatimonadales bacterium]